MNYEEKPIWKMLRFIALSILAFLGINLIYNYLMLFISYQKTKTLTGVSLGEHLKFKISYLYIAGNIDIKVVVMMSFIIDMLLSLKIETYLKVKYGNKTVKGDDRFLTEKELKKDKTLYSFPADKPKTAKKSGIPVALVKNIVYVCYETVHSLIVGTTRSGKGQTFVLPMIRYIAMSKSKHSMVINDPKGEIIENTYPILKENGYKIVVLNLRDTKLSMSWDLLKTIKDEYINARQTDGDFSKTIKLITSLASLFTDNPKSDPIWPDSARALLVSMILYLLEKGYDDNNIENVTMYSVYNFFIEFGTKDEQRTVGNVKKTVNMLDELFQSLPVGNPAKSAYANSNFAKGEMRSSIFSTLSSNINIFGTDMGISKITSKNQIDFADLINPQKPCAMFIVVPDEEVSRHVISSLFVNQCYNALVEYSTKFFRKRLPQRVHFILDEFGNMPRIPAMENKITVGAGRNILFNLFVQDLNQLDTIYDNSAKTIRSNCGNFIYINSLDKDTNEYVSAILGNKTISYDTYSGHLDEWLKNRNVNVDREHLMSATQLGRMEFGETIVIRQRSFPIKTKFTPFYKLNIPEVFLEDIPLPISDQCLEDVIYPLNDILMTLGKQMTLNGQLVGLSVDNVKEYNLHHNNLLNIEIPQTNDDTFENGYTGEVYDDYGEIEEELQTQDMSLIFEKFTSSLEVKQAYDEIVSKCTEFEDALQNGNLELCRSLIEKNQKVNRISKSQAEILMLALSQL